MGIPLHLLPPAKLQKRNSASPCTFIKPSLMTAPTSTRLGLAAALKQFRLFSGPKFAYRIGFPATNWLES